MWAVSVKYQTPRRDAKDLLLSVSRKQLIISPTVLLPFGRRWFHCRIFDKHVAVGSVFSRCPPVCACVRTCLVEGIL